MKMSLCHRGAARILTAVAWLLCFVPTTTQRGPQFYFQNPPAQPSRLLPSTFPQSGFNQYQNFFPPVHTGPEAYSPFRPTGSQPPGRALQDSQQQYNLQGYQQQPGLHPSPFQLPPNIPGHVQPQQYSTFQTINPPASHDQIGTPPAFFQQQQPAYQPIPNQEDIKKTSAAVPTPQSSPQGTPSSKYTPRDPNNLRLIQGFSRYQPSPAFEDRFSTTKQPKRTQNGFDSFVENHRTSLFSRPFPIDDIHVNSFVDQRLEVDDAAAGDPKSNSQQTSSIQKDKNADSTLRKKTNSRTHPNSRNNIPAQRTRLSPSDLRNRAPIQNDSYSREEAETVFNSPTQKFRGRNRDNYFQSSTTTTTSAPPTRPRSRFGTTKPPSRLSHQFNVRPTFSSRKVTTTSTTEPEPPVDPLVFGSEEVLYDDGYDQDKSSEVTPKSTSTTDPTVIYNVTTFRYTTEKSKDSLGNDSNYSSKEETPVNGTSISVPASTTVDNSENEDTETDSSSSAEKEEDNSEENDSREESNRTTYHDDLIDESEIPENHPYWSTDPENNTFVNNERANEDVSGNATGAFEILTMNPQHVLVEQDNFKTFVDSGLIDATEIPLTSPESLDNVTEKPDVSRPVQSTSTSTTPETPISLSPSEENEGRPMEEAIVSVVTTKSVINGTSMIVTMPPVAEVTGQVAPTGQEESSENNTTTSTESWVIVASVQTSRSVSGARFLPPIIRQEERVLPVSVKSFNTETIPKNKGAPTSEERTTKSSASFISTESIIDKLDRVQSELSSGILTGGEVQLEVLTEKPGAILPQMNIGRTTEPPTSTTTYKSPVFIRKFSPHHGSLPPKKNQEGSSGIQDDEHPKSKLPGLRPITLQKASTSDDLMNKPQGDQPSLPVTNSKLRNGIRASGGRSSALSNFQNRVKSQDPSSLPSEHKVRTGTANETKSINIKDFISSLKFEDVSSLLPPGYNASKFETSSQPKSKESISQANSTTETNHTNVLFQKANIDDISAFLPPGYKERNQYSSTTAKPKGLESIFQKAAQDGISAFLPPGYEKQAKTSTASPEKNKDFESLFSKAKTDDIKSLLPSGYVTQAKPLSTTTEKPNPLEKLFSKAKQEDIGAFLPPGFVPQAKEPSTTEKTGSLESILNGAKAVDINVFLPPGFKLSTEEPVHGIGGGTNDDSSSPESTTKSFKVKFPSVPGMTRRTTLRPTTTTKSFAAPKPSLAPIQKGWPTRVTTLFTGWSTPSTTPIARILETTKTTESTTSTTSTTTTTTTTTTTPQPTTPGTCTVNCDLEATIKLVGSEQWIPELLDHNTREWQDMANEVRSQLQSVFTKSESLGQWFRQVRIDDFSEGREGSVLVDYYVELTDLGRQLNTQELKRLFHDSLKESSPLNEEEVQDDSEDDRNETSVFNGTDYKSPENLQNLLKLGRFDVDPMYTDFKVVLKHQEPTVGYAEEDIFIPQWAIAGIVIGLASLLFVIIFGVTVLVNRHKNNKKKQPTPLTEDMLNELNKNHMGGLDNYAAEDLYNMEDVWNEKPHEKPPKKRSSASVQENSMSNLYDSWRSEWNGYYYNAYYGNGSSTSGYTRRRSDYDTNF